MKTQLARLARSLCLAFALGAGGVATAASGDTAEGSLPAQELTLNRSASISQVCMATRSMSASAATENSGTMFFSGNTKKDAVSSPCCRKSSTTV